MENPMQETVQPELPKLRAFKAIQKNLAVAGIGPKLVTQSYPLNGRIFTGFLLLVSATSFICVHILNYAETFSEYTQCFFLGSAALLITASLAILTLKVENLFEFIDNFDQILNKTLKYSTTTPIHYETNQFEEKLSEILLYLITKLSPLCVFVPWIGHVTFIYFTTDLGTAAFELPCPMWLPFDWRNPIGFLFAITIQYAMTKCGFMIGACVLILAIASYLYVIALSKIIKGSLFAINQSIQTKKCDQFILLEQIIEFLEFHSNTKQIINEFSDLFQQFITMVFAWSLVTICGALIMIQIQLVQYISVIIHHGNIAELLITLLEIIYGFGVLLITCELGQRLNLAFAECGELVDDFDWYLFPTKIQQMLPLILYFTQQPIEIKCFGSKACDRDTFKSVTKTAFSYFTVLREFYY